MPLNLYKQVFNEYFISNSYQESYDEAYKILKASKRIFFIGNGGSNSICSHMYEDYAKIGRYQTFTFSDPALITCFANDYGYENSFAEWLKIYMGKDDLLIAISSSGNSPNILNAVKTARQLEANIITLSGFRSDNKLKREGDVNFHIACENYGIVECYHQVILHVLLDNLTIK